MPNVKVGINDVNILPSLEERRRDAVAAVRDFAGVIGNGVPNARFTTFSSMLLREVLAGGPPDAVVDFRAAGFFAGGGEGAVLGSFFWRLRMSFPRSSSALL